MLYMVVADRGRRTGEKAMATEWWEGGSPKKCPRSSRREKMNQPVPVQSQATEPVTEHPHLTTFSPPCHKPAKGSTCNNRKACCRARRVGRTAPEMSAAKKRERKRGITPNSHAKPQAQGMASCPQKAKAARKCMYVLCNERNIVC